MNTVRLLRRFKASTSSTVRKSCDERADAFVAFRTALQSDPNGDGGVLVGDGDSCCVRAGDGGLAGVGGASPGERDRAPRGTLIEFAHEPSLVKAGDVDGDLAREGPAAALEGPAAVARAGGDDDSRTLPTSPLSLDTGDGVGECTARGGEFERVNLSRLRDLVRDGPAVAQYGPAPAAGADGRVVTRLVTVVLWGGGGLRAAPALIAVCPSCSVFTHLSILMLSPKRRYSWAAALLANTLPGPPRPSSCSARCDVPHSSAQA
ncbi:hypothetical protein CYMTET_40161 [Cymbomonas tetramitiformis]|uniref:Uncharacterized protein n=1 Tax=Cymbomonas tetramitiformis TaxID=36881 RepID=A0AAE0C8P2_9CHLO|nr:hypothetical protein CYMTET_40161 [Cymbomonas tetramitiformis]